MEPQLINNMNNQSDLIASDSEPENDVIDSEKVTLINPKTNKAYPKPVKQYPSPPPYEQTPSFQYLDKIIESLTFSRYHLATLCVCAFSIMCGGFVSSHFIFSKNLLIVNYTWTLTTYSCVFIFQNLIGAIGAFISVTSTTNEWDIHSNVLIGLIGLLSVVLMTFYNEGPLYIILIFMFNYCQGFINNICCNFLLEEFKLKYRELAFVFVSSFRLIGCGLFGLSAYIVYDKYENDDPIINIWVLAILQLCLTLSLCFFYDSPRLLYYNASEQDVFKYIQASTDPLDNVGKYKETICKRIKETQREIRKTLPSQKYSNLFLHFTQLWQGPYLVLSLKAVIFVFLSCFLMSNIKDSYSYFFHDKSKYLFIISDENAPHYRIPVYYLCVFIGVLVICALKYFLNMGRKLLCLICLVGCFVFLILMIFFNKHFIYFLGAFETLAVFYHIMVYMYFSTYITTQLRNSMTSLLYITLTVSMIFQSVLLNSMANYTLFGYLNFGVVIILVLLEMFLIDEDTKDLQLQQIEIKLLRAMNTSINKEK